MCLSAAGPQAAAAPNEAPATNGGLPSLLHPKQAGRASSRLHACSHKKNWAARRLKAGAGPRAAKRQLDNWVSNSIGRGSKLAPQARACCAQLGPGGALRGAPPPARALAPPRRGATREVKQRHDWMRVREQNGLDNHAGRHAPLFKGARSRPPVRANRRAARVSRASGSVPGARVSKRARRRRGRAGAPARNTRRAG